MESEKLKINDSYLFVHLWVVQHRDKLFHERLACNLLVEWRAASVHHDVEQAEREEDHAQIRSLQTSKKTVRHYLGTIKILTIFLSK